MGTAYRVLSPTDHSTIRAIRQRRYKAKVDSLFTAQLTPNWFVGFGLVVCARQPDVNRHADAACSVQRAALQQKLLYARVRGYRALELEIEGVFGVRTVARFACSFGRFV